MPSVEYGRFGHHQPAAVNRRTKVHVDYKKRKPQQEICACLKWICFFMNFIVFLVGVTCLALGIYLCVKDPRAILEWADVVLNPAIVLIIIGLAICIVSLFGSLGALRDSVTLLKTFALCVFFCYITIVICTFFLFILFYSDTTDGLSAHSILLYSIERYHTNRNIADFVDYLQEQLECCGASSASQGYRDWQRSEQFNCSDLNPHPERCGVPFSCCRRSVISEAAGSANPLLPAMRSLECWQHAQTKRAQELEADLYTRGCLQPLRVLFESHAVRIGAVVAFILIPVCISVCLTNLLARQIDHQHYLLEREARRNERRRRREKHKFRDPFAAYDTAITIEPELLEKKVSLDHTRKTSDTRASPGVASSDNNSATAPIIPPQCNNEKKILQQQHQRHHHHHRQQQQQQQQQRKTSSTSPRRAMVESKSRKTSRGSSVEGILGLRRHNDKKRRSITTPLPVESRVHQWVLQQSDFVGHEPFA